jgi:hypothetical protein
MSRVVEEEKLMIRPPPSKRRDASRSALKTPLTLTAKKPIKLVVGGLIEPFVMDYSGIIDLDVNATESLDRGIDQGPDILRLAHVSLNGQRPSTAGFDGLNDLLRGNLNNTL